MSSTLPKRSELPAETTWDVYSIFPDDGAWEVAAAALEAYIPRLEAFRGRRGESAAKLLEWILLLEQLIKDEGKVYIYAQMFYDVDTTDAAAAARFGRVTALGTRVSAARSGAETEIAAIGPDRIKAFQAEEPELRRYAHYLHSLLRLHEHYRSGEVEEVLALGGDSQQAPFSAWSSLNDADLKFGAVTNARGETRAIEQGTLRALLEDPDRALRRAAWEQYSDAYVAVRQTEAALLAGHVKGSIFRARVRRFASSREGAMAASFIPTEVFDTMVAVFREQLPVWHRYWKVRRRALGVDRLAVYDIWAPLTTREPEVTYPQAVECLLEALAPLGAEYVGQLRRGLGEERWVDVYANQGKRSGAYSGGACATRPFALLNWSGGIGEQSTLAHEIGHSMHSHFFNLCQTPLNASPGTFVAEVASNLNQALLRDHLFRRNSDRDFQLAMLGETFWNFHRYMFLMPTLARFEDEIYRRAERGEGLTADSMCALMVELFQEGYGGEFEIDAARIGITWAQFIHLYLTFYTYSYTTGIAAAAALAEGILDGWQGGPPPEKPSAAAAAYLGCLKAGGSLDPIDVLKLAGIDMASPEPLRRAFRTLDGMIDRLERLLE